MPRKIDVSRRKELLNYRQLLVEEYQKHSEGFDKTLLTISSTALGVSIAFQDSFNGQHVPTNTLFLIMSWVFWALSVLSILGSTLKAIDGRKRLIETLDSALEKGSEKRRWKVSNWAFNLSLIASIFLGLGIASFLYFAVLNLL